MQNLLNYINIKKYRNILAFFIITGLILHAAHPFFIYLFAFQHYGYIPPHPTASWSIFLEFTTETGLLLFFTLLFFPKHRWLVMAGATYTTVVMIIYYVLMVPDWFSPRLWKDNFVYRDTAMPLALVLLPVFYNTILHVVVPTGFIFFYALTHLGREKINFRKMPKVYGLLTIYPILYFLLNFFLSRHVKHFEVNCKWVYSFQFWSLRYGPKWPEATYINMEVVRFFLFMYAFFSFIIVVHILVNNLVYHFSFKKQETNWMKYIVKKTKDKLSEWTKQK